MVEVLVHQGEGGSVGTPGPRCWVRVEVLVHQGEGGSLGTPGPRCWVRVEVLVHQDPVAGWGWGSVDTPAPTDGWGWKCWYTSPCCWVRVKCGYTSPCWRVRVEVLVKPTSLLGKGGTVGTPVPADGCWYTRVRLKVVVGGCGDGWYCIVLPVPDVLQSIVSYVGARTSRGHVVTWSCWGNAVSLFMWCGGGRVWMCDLLVLLYCWVDLSGVWFNHKHVVRSLWGFSKGWSSRQAMSH